MQPEEQKIMDIPTMEGFIKFRDSLNLTDRQKEIFVLKYSRGLRNIDIAEELNPPCNQNLVGEELKIIRKKLAAVIRENPDRGLTY